VKAVDVHHNTKDAKKLKKHKVPSTTCYDDDDDDDDVL